MNQLIVKEFNGNKLHTFMWNNKPCWIANEIVSMFDYADPSKTISQCVEAEEFEIGIEYEVLKGKSLKEFATTLEVVTTNLVSSKTRNLTIFFEDGLYGFLQYTDKPIGVQFRKWLRRDVLPEIRQTGTYITNNASPEMLRDKATELERLQLAYNSTSMLKDLLEDVGMDNKAKLLTAKALYKQAGIDLPIEIEEEQHFYDTKQIASQLEVYSKSNKPAFQAVGAIIKKLNISENNKKTVWESNGSWSGTVTKYTQHVIDQIRGWLQANDYPTTIPSEKKNFYIVYKTQEVL